MKIRTVLPFATLAIAMAAGTHTAQAADVTQPTETSINKSRFDMSFGATLASEYMFRGLTQTLNDPAVQGFVEASYGMLYVGTWASNVDFGPGDPQVEIDFYAGIRPEFGVLALDLGVVRYVYPGASALHFTEVYAKAKVNPYEPLTVGAAVFSSPDLSNEDGVYLEANAAYALPHDFALSGAVGYQIFDDAIGSQDYLTWNLGLSYSWKETVTLDQRYHDNDLDGGQARIVGSVSFSTSYSALKAM